MKRFWILALPIFFALNACFQQQSLQSVPGDGLDLTTQAAGALFFSEYIEGSGNNKALEIFNGTGADVDLGAAGYKVQMFFNGAASAGLTIDLTGVVAAGDVFVLAHSGAVSQVLDRADQTNGSSWFNGNDPVTLRRGAVVVDSIGQVGFDPGSEWGSGLVSTANNTLRRSAQVCAGDPNPDESFDPAAQWDGFAQDTFDGLGSHTAACGDVTPVINEFVSNHTGVDTHEFIEVKGSANTDHSELTLLQIEGDGSGAGVIDGVYQVGVTDAGGYWTTGFMASGLENGSLTLLLVQGFVGSLGDDLDTDNDGWFDSAPWTAVVDGVAVSDGGSLDLVYADTVLAPSFDGGTFTVGGASRIPDGADTESVSDWARNDFDGLGLPGFVGSGDEGEAVNTPGTHNELVEIAPPSAIGRCGDDATLIHEIQGSGFVSPLIGSSVVIEGIVVGDFQTGSALRGFYLQEETGDQDGDPGTSEGIFVFEGDAPLVDVVSGEVVRVAGMADEFGSLTQVTGVTDVVVCSTGATATPVELELPLTAAELEQVEGMLVVFPQNLVISEYFDFDRFGEIVLAFPLEGLDRPFQPTSYAEPGSLEAAEIGAAIVERRITLDDGRSSQNPDPAIHPNGNAFDLSNRFRGGDLVKNAVGVLDYRFGRYRIQPTGGAEYTSSNPRPLAPESVGGDLKVATLNVLNYFVTLDTGAEICGPSQGMGCRGAEDAEELGRQRAKILAALVAMDADVVGLIELENTAGVEPMADLVAGLNSTLGAGTYAYVDTGVIGEDVIRQGFIYKPSTVTPFGDHAVLDAIEFVRPNGTGFNRPALAQTFIQNLDGARFTAVVNHLKSKGSPCGPGDDDPEQGNCNLTRTLAAQELLDWLATDPTDSGDDDFLILGDLNAYDEEEPIGVLGNSGYVDLGERFVGELAYTYVFDGQFGHLDYAMANGALEWQVTGATNWHINADEPDILDYNTTLKQLAQKALFEPNAFRSSDHDPVIVGLDLNAPPTCGMAQASRDSLWPPNHMMEPIRIDGVTDPEGDSFAIEITGIFQDEPVDLEGDLDGNTSPD